MIIIKDKAKQSKIYVSRYDSLTQSNINNGGAVDGEYITESKLYSTLEDYLKKNGIKTINGESIVGEGNIVIESSDVECSTPDWNAQKGEVGYIENKPFTDNLTVEATYIFEKSRSIVCGDNVYVKHMYYKHSNEELTIEYGLITPTQKYGPFSMTVPYDDNGAEMERYISISQDAYDDASYLEGYYFAATLIGDEGGQYYQLLDEQVYPLSEVFIPDTISRKSDVDEECENLWDETLALWENIGRIDAVVGDINNVLENIIG